MSSVYRVYEDVGADGYPPEWHETIKHLVREQAGHRCIRCLHPYLIGAHAMEIDSYTEDGRPIYASWSPCDSQCRHGGPTRERQPGYPAAMYMGPITEARARILTVHHLTGEKADCRWWNLVSLCQRCHLRVQRIVVMPRIWPWPHSDWFKPYAAGYYASVYLGEELQRHEVEARLGELLALEAAA